MNIEHFMNRAETNTQNYYASGVIVDAAADEAYGT